MNHTSAMFPLKLNPSLKMDQKNASSLSSSGVTKNRSFQSAKARKLHELNSFLVPKYLLRLEKFAHALSDLSTIPTHFY